MKTINTTNFLTYHKACKILIIILKSARREKYLIKITITWLNKQGIKTHA